jgi:hypothetical protein
MGLWLTRRVLLAVFIAANLASALPLVYCLAPGGHHAVELAHTSPHGGSRAQGADKEVSKRNFGAALTVLRDCLDLAMLPSAGASSRPIDVGLHKRVPPALPPVLAFASLPVALLREARIAQHTSLASGKALEARRTVVLLI